MAAELARPVPRVPPSAPPRHGLAFRPDVGTGRKIYLGPEKSKWQGADLQSGTGARRANQDRWAWSPHGEYDHGLTTLRAPGSPSRVFHMLIVQGSRVGVKAHGRPHYGWSAPG